MWEGETEQRSAPLAGASKEARSNTHAPSFSAPLGRLLAPTSTLLFNGERLASVLRRGAVPQALLHSLPSAGQLGCSKPHLQQVQRALPSPAALNWDPDPWAAARNRNSCFFFGKNTTDT